MALVSRHRAAVYGLALHLLGDPDEADEAAQEAFVRAYEFLGRFRGRRFGPWVRGIVANVCCERRRHRGRFETAPADLASKLESRCGSARWETVMVVREAMRSLPDSLSVPLALFYLDGASVQDVAEALSLSPGTVRVRLHRGRERLRERLSALFEDGE